MLPVLLEKHIEPERIPMDILIVATKSCHHRPEMERWLQQMDLDYRVAYVEDEPEQAARFQIRHSPNLVIDDELVFRGLPSRQAFEQRLKQDVA